MAPREVSSRASGHRRSGDPEILKLPRETIERLILGAPLVLRVGSAIILGSFKLDSNRLIIELAQIEGGDEGVLMVLASFAKRYAKLRNLSAIGWVVHRVLCQAQSELRRVLERRGFIVAASRGSD